MEKPGIPPGAHPFWSRSRSGTLCLLAIFVVACALAVPARLAVRAQEPPVSASSDLRLWISEVMPDPVALDDQGNWVEIANLGAAPVNLKDWALRTGDGRTVVVPADALLAGGQYGVLAERGSAAIESGLPLLAVVGPLALDTRDSLTLLSPDGTVRDEVRWGENPAVQPGRSLERTGPAPDAWAVAQTQWPGSRGDYGTPGQPWQPPPTPTASPAPTASPTPTPLPPLAISEVMADPAAVPDDTGEWIEVWNPNPYTVDLAGWQFEDSRGSRFTLPALFIGAQAHTIVGRSADASANGGVQVDALFATVRLANAGDSLRLLGPDGSEVDRFAWDAALCLPGRSIERADGVLRSAVGPWPGSAGDWGSPHAPAPPAPTPTPTLTPLPPTPTATPLPGQWSLGGAPSPLQIDELAYRGDGAYIALMNIGAEPLRLAGWSLTDAAAPAAGEGILLLPDVVLAAGAGYIIAQDGAAFAARWQVAPDAQVRATAAGVAVLEPHPAYPRGPFALNDGGDEVLLLSPGGAVADVVVYGSGDGALSGVAGTLRAPEGHALVRVEGAPWPIVADMRHRFLVAPADPIYRRRAPAPAPHAPVALGDGLLAWWGSLGTPSTFAGGSLPPLAVLAEAAAQGLDFVALADAAPHASLPFAPPITLLPAWQWEGDGDRAILYTLETPPLPDRWAVLPFLDARDFAVQWQRRDWLNHAATRVLPADGLRSAQDSAELLAAWRRAGRPLLPAGNTLSLFTMETAAPRYTGLAAPDASSGALLDALRAGRGWLASAPTLALALSAQVAEGMVWMGGSLAPANRVTLRVYAQDTSAQPLAVTLWQEGAAVATWDALPGAPAREVAHMALPDTFLYVTAARADGAFAASAPLYVLPNGDGALVIAEVVANPASDLNGDGAADDKDEFVELLNLGGRPVALEGWQLFDSRGAVSGQGRHIFRRGEVIAAGERRVLWRAETGLVLNNGREWVYLFRPGGGLADEVGWEELGAGLAAARGDDGVWQYGIAPSPGAASGVQVVPPAAGEVVAAAAVASPQVVAAAAVQGEDPAPVLAAAPAAEAVGSAAQPAALAPAGESIAVARTRGIEVATTVRGVVTLSPGLLHSLIYIGEPAPDGATAGPGLRVYLPLGDFPPLAAGDWVEVRGVLQSFRGERELRPAGPAQVVATGSGVPLQPAVVPVAQVGEAFEGRLVRLEGLIASTDGDSLFLIDPAAPEMPPVRVMVARSLGWPPPAALPGEAWQVTGIVSQSARAAPWNGGYRVLVRTPEDLIRLH